MRKIPCELTLGNGGDIIAMVALTDEGILLVPRTALYGIFPEGVLSCRVLQPEHLQLVQRQTWLEESEEQ